jgi:hypothetical protein
MLRQSPGADVRMKPSRGNALGRQQESGAGGFALAGSIMAACAAGGLRSRSAHAFYQPAGHCP